VSMTWRAMIICQALPQLASAPDEPAALSLVSIIRVRQLFPECLLIVYRCTGVPIQHTRCILLPAVPAPAARS
jgi:hypothetical protein